MNIPEATSVSRRRFLLSAGVAGAVAWLGPRRLFGDELGSGDLFTLADGPVQQIRRAAATDPIGVQKLRRNVSVLAGSGGNIVTLPGPDGVLLVDSGIVGPKVAAAVATLTRAPIKQVVNTHWHFDHTDANAWLRSRGATIIAHENTRKRLSTETRVADWDFTFPPSPTAAIPTIVFNKARSLDVNGSRIALKGYAPAHTDSDISVHFADADVLHVGDTWWNGLYPFIDYSTGGSIDGTIRATEENLATASVNTIIVPGHGAVGNRTALRSYRDMLAAVRDRVAALKASGRTVVEVIAAKPSKSFDATWGRAIISPDFFTRLVYQGV